MDEEKERLVSSPIELRVYNKEDRKIIASILFDNGYTVRQGKRQRTPTGKSVDYLVVVTDREGVSTDK